MLSIVGYYVYTTSNPPQRGFFYACNSSRHARCDSTESLSVGGGFEIVAAQIYIHFVVNPPVRRGYMTRQQAKLLLADKSELLLVMQQFTGRHPALQPLIYPGLSEINILHRR
jgi:hypothetical protein